MKSMNTKAPEKGITVIQGRKVNGRIPAKLHLCSIDCDNHVSKLTYNQFKKCEFETEVIGNHIQQEAIRSLLAQITQFNKKVDYNNWVNTQQPNFWEKVDYLITKLGAKWSKSGLKLEE